MSFQPLPVGTPVYTTTTVPSGAIQMVKVGPVPTQVIVQQPAYIQAQPIRHIVTQPLQTPIVTQAPPQLVSNEPSITVFVGNITDRASDTLIRQILMKCGSVVTWKRVQGASGKLQAFGFCEYRDCESALRAINILHDYKLGEKKLLVKVDAKTQIQIDEWKKKQKKFQLQGVVEAKNSLGSLLLEYTNELNTARGDDDVIETLQAHNREHPTVRESNNVEENLEQLDIEDEQKLYISKEIRSFREIQRQQDEKQRQEREKEPPSRHRDIARRERRHSSRSRRSPRRSPIRGIRRSRSPRRPRRSPIRSRSRKRSASSSPIRLGDFDDDTDGHEKRRMLRKIKEKEAAYKDRLKSHEIRERRRKRDFEKKEERERRLRKEMEREAKRLREFLADYDDERFDAKFYSGSELAKRREDREIEAAFDQKDRKKEMEEIEMLRKRLRAEKHPDPENAIQNAIRATEEIWTPLIAPETPIASKPEVASVTSSSSGDSASEESIEAGDDVIEAESEMEVKAMTSSPPPPQQPMASPPQLMTSSIPEPEVETKFKRIENSGNSPKQEPMEVVKTVTSSPTSIAPMTTGVVMTSSRQKLTVSDIFNQDEEEDEVPKKRRLVPLEYTEEEIAAATSSGKIEDKKRLQRELIERIPTEKSSLFAYVIDWSVVDAGLMSSRIQPWISKKIIEYIGEEEATLVEFICSKIMSKSDPEKIHEDISMVLDDEAEVFVMKLWRLLIYEIEAKKAGF